MSFYVGKPSGTPRCHITHGTHTLAQMRGNVFSDTIFHSDVSYPTFTSHNITEFQDNVVTFWPGERSPPPESEYPQVTTVRIPTTAHTAIKAGYAYLFINTAGAIVLPTPVNIYYGATDAYVGKGAIGTQWAPYTYYLPPHYITNSPTYVGSNSEEYTGEIGAVFPRGTRISQILVFNFSTSTYQQYPSITGNEVTIKAGTFSVGNLDLATLKYISGDTINSTDKTAAQATTGINPFQLVNSVPATGAVTMQSNSTGTFLKVGAKNIIRSDFPLPTYQSTLERYGVVSNNVFGERLILTLNDTPLQERDILFGTVTQEMTVYISPYSWYTERVESFLLSYTEGATYYFQHGVYRYVTDYWQPIPNKDRGGSYYIRMSGGYARVYSNLVSLGGLADDVVTQSSSDIALRARTMRIH